MSEILSVQSHVANGYVGNRAAMFSLQRLGWEVTCVNTVQFSNHTGHRSYQGEVFSAAHIRQVIEGVEQLVGFEGTRALLTGYMGDPEAGGVVLDALERVRRANPAALYCCDPVLGDPEGGCFVPTGVQSWIRDHAMPAADIITPNQFELGWLTGREIHDMDDALTAAAELRAQGPSVVFLTSLVLPGDPKTLFMIVNTAEGSWRVSTPVLELKSPESGSGDFSAATFLAGCLEYGMTGGGPARAMARAASAIRRVLETTLALGRHELALVQAQDQMASAGPDDIRIDKID